MRAFLRDYGLAVALAALFIVSWLLQSVTGWVDFVAEQQSHGDEARLFGDSGYFWHWMEATFENWQSEFLQLFTMVVLTAFLVHKGSSESKDSDDELMLQISLMRDQLDEIQKAGEKGGKS